MDTSKFELADEIQAILIGSPHNDSPEKLAQEIATKVLALIKPVGYVQLADDQTFPPVRQGISTTAISYQQAAQDDMFSAGWRKVELEEAK